MSQVATIKSIATPYFGSAAKEPDFRPSAEDLALALGQAQAAARKAGKPFAIHHDGRAYVPYQPMPNSKRRSYAEQAAAARSKKRAAAEGPYPVQVR